MGVVARLVVAEQLAALQDIVDSWSWKLTECKEEGFTIGLPASDGRWYWLKIECDGFPEQPPAFHWYDPESEAMDQPQCTPKGKGYLHSSGVVCAPWNRLSYKKVFSKGPHGDWDLSNWMSNPKTGGTTTLAAMILRIYVELNGPNYQGPAT